MKRAIVGLGFATMLALGALLAQDAPGENLTLETALPAVFDQPIATSVARNEYGNAANRYYVLELDAAAGETRFDAVVANPTNARLGLEYMGADDYPIDRADKADDGELRLKSYVLGPGRHVFRVTALVEKEEPTPPFTLTFEAKGRWQTGEEREPNGEVKTATTGPIAAGMKGEVAREGDYDVFAFEVGAPLQLWTIEATGPTVKGIVLVDAGGRDIKRGGTVSESETGQLWSVLLPPGRAFFRISAEPGDWAVKATPQGPAPIEVLGGEAAPRKPGETDEVEPNDGRERALILKLDGSRAGQIESGEDEDVYRFTVDGETKVRLTLSGPADMRLRAITTRFGASNWEAGRLRVDAPKPAEGAAPAADGAISADYLLPQGDYFVEVKGDRREQRPYELKLERLPYYGAETDLEPNDDIISARPVPQSLRVAGTMLPDDIDWYRLPDTERPTTLTVTALVPTDDLALRVGKLVLTESPSGPQRWEVDDSEGRMERSEDEKSHTLELPAGRDRYLRVGGGGIGPYELQIAFADGPQPVTVGNDLSAALTIDAPAVAAFTDAVQRVTAKLSVKNAGAAAIDAAPAFHLSDDRWLVEGGPATVRIEAGATADIPVTLIAPAMLADGATVILSAEATGGGAAAHAEASIAVTADAAPVAAERRWPLPDAMLGGINVAWNALGGTAPESAARLIDGYATSGTAERMDASDDPADVAILDLAGDQPVMLSGVTVNPTIGTEMANQVRRLAIETSPDGVTYTRQFEGEIGARQREYALPFAAPVAAKYVKVLALLAQSISPATAEIGEVKAIATPEAAAAIAPGGFNIADPKLGGWVAAFHPADIEFNTILANAERPTEVRYTDEAERTMYWTIGFRDHRAARVASMAWVDAAELKPENMIQRVAISTAMDAKGPYTKSGVWELTRAPDGSIAPFVFPGPVWARFVRFDVEVPPKAENGWATYVSVPRLVSIFEAPPGPEGGSIVGEWGEANRDGPYEKLNPRPLPQGAAAVAAGGADRASARPLPLDQALPGRASAGTRVDWWAVDVPPEGQSLTVTLNGTPGLAVVAAVEDAAGKAVPATVSQDDGVTRIATAKVAPGRYYVRVEEPPRSIVISWDTSGSVGPYVPTIIQSIRGFARYLTPGRDEVNMVPFRDPDSVPLLETWTGEPMTAFATLNAYDWADQSSNAESGLIGSLKALDGRPGTRAVILITDYATGKSTEMRMGAIDLLAKTGARVFNFAIPSGSGPEDAAFERGLMLSFAAYSNGTAAYAGNPADLEQAFAQTAAALRAPKDYTIAAAVGFKPPEPGFVSVVVPESEAAAPASKDRAVLVILDASGSMLKKLGKKRRIEIAKETLNELTQTMLPEGTPLAMRVFGDTKPDSCETNLRLPLAPLDRAAAKGVVDKIVSINKAKTAIGASLALAAEDLAEAKGQKLIILITDGEETCEGDPAAEIAALRDKGIDARISIVGFAVDDQALKDTFTEWAEAGGGGYFDATKPGDLAPAVRKALLPPYEVVAADGAVVATGVAGGAPVEAPPGTYTIRVLTDPPQEFPGIVVESGGTASVTLGE